MHGTGFFATKKVRVEDNRTGVPPHALGKAGFETFQGLIQAEIPYLSTLDI